MKSNKTESIILIIIWFAVFLLSVYTMIYIDEKYSLWFWSNAVFSVIAVFIMFGGMLTLIEKDTEL